MPSPNPAFVTGALAIGLLLAAVFALGPTEPSTPDTEPLVRPTVRTARIRSRPTVGPTPSVVREAPAAGELLQDYLAEHYGSADYKTSWHDNIRRVAVRSGTAIVETDLTDEPGDQPKVSAISRAVLQFRDTWWGRQMSGLSVEVYGLHGRLLGEAQAPEVPIGRLR